MAFVAPWCGVRLTSSQLRSRKILIRRDFQHCKNLAPEYEKAAKSFNSLVPLYAVDCDAEANKPLCGQQVGVFLEIGFGAER